MITELLISLFVTLSNFVINFLPTFNQVNTVTIAVTSLVPIIKAVSPFMPVQALGVGMTIFMFMNGFKLSMSLINWVIRKIPTLS